MTVGRMRSEDKTAFGDMFVDINNFIGGGLFKYSNPLLVGKFLDMKKKPKINNNLILYSLKKHHHHRFLADWAEIISNPAIRYTLYSLVELYVLLCIMHEGRPQLARDKTNHRVAHM